MSNLCENQLLLDSCELPGERLIINNNNEIVKWEKTVKKSDFVRSGHKQYSVPVE